MLRMRFTTGLTSSLVALAGLAGCASDSDSLAADTEALTRDQASFLAASLAAASPTTQPISLSEAAAVVGLDDVCPTSRQDDLCVSLRAGDDAGSRSIVHARLAGTARVAGQADPADEGAVELSDELHGAILARTSQFRNAIDHVQPCV